MNKNGKKKISPLQKRFCEEYIIDLNGTQAVLRAGYKTKAPYAVAYNLLENSLVQEELTKLVKKEDKNREKRKQKYIDELEKIALSDITKYELKLIKYQDLKGENKVKIKIYLDDEADKNIYSTAAIQEISTGKNGTKIKTHNKVAALIKLIDREDKLDELAEKEDKENDGFIEALNSEAVKVWEDEK